MPQEDVKTPAATRRLVVLLPLSSPPRTFPAAHFLYEQCEELCGGRIVQIPLPEWRNDAFRLVLATHPQVANEDRRNDLASRLLGASVYGTCVLARRPARDEKMFGPPEDGDRNLLYLGGEEAQAVLDAIATEIEMMHLEADAEKQVAKAKEEAAK